MKRSEVIVKASTLKMTLKFDETATFEILTGLLTVRETQMTSKLYILRTKLSEAIMVTISDAVTYTFGNEEELQKFLSKRFERFDTEKEMYMAFTGMDEETWNEWNEGM